jgi:glutathione S-transferase
MLELFADEILLPAIRPIMHRSVPPTDAASREREEAEGLRAEAAIVEHYRFLETKARGANYLFGDFSIADIGVFMALTFSLRLKGPRLDPFPQLAAWYARVAARPAVAKVKDDLIAADRELSPALYA